MSNAADGYLGDWVSHRPTCRCLDCQLERADKRIAQVEAERDALREALKVLMSACISDCGLLKAPTVAAERLARAALAHATAAPEVTQGEQG